MESFEQKYKIELTEINMNFCIRPTTVLRYMQETFARFCAKHNLAGYDVYEMGLKWVFGKIFVEFLDVIPMWNEEITVKIHVSNFQRLRMFLNLEISTQRGLVAKSQLTAYLLDLETSRPQPVDKFLEMFNVDKNSLNEEVIKYNFKNEGEPILKYSHKVSLSDIDYNQHTNNISYVTFALSTTPKEYVLNKFPKILEIKYLKETFLNDTLDCSIKEDENAFEYTITDNKDNSLVCIINAIWGEKVYSREYFLDLIKKQKLEFFR